MDLYIKILAGAIVGIGGFKGGIWLWQKILESLPPQKRRYLKIGGPPASALFIFVIILFWKMEAKPPECLQKYISCLNNFSWLLLFYMLGYDASILRPASKKRKAKSRVYCDLLKNELFASMIVIALAVALLFFSAIDIQVFKMWVAGVMGFAIAFLFWEYLMEAVILTGPFKIWLVIFSLLTTAWNGLIVGYGFYIHSSPWNPVSIQKLLMGTMLFYDLLACYMLALCVAIFRAQ